MKTFEIITNVTDKKVVFKDVPGYQKLEIVNAWNNHVVGYKRGNKIFTFVIHADRVVFYKTDYIHNDGDFDKRFPVTDSDFKKFCDILDIIEDDYVGGIFGFLYFY